MLLAILLVFAVGQVNAFLSFPELVKRQFDPTMVPAVCQGSCASLGDLSNCMTAGCFCSADYVTVITTCVDCAVAEGAAQTAAQSVLDQYVQACAGMGVTLQSLIATSSLPSDTSTTLTLPTDSAASGSASTITDTSANTASATVTTDSAGLTITLTSIASNTNTAANPAQTGNGAENVVVGMGIAALSGLLGAALVL